SVPKIESWTPDVVRLVLDELDAYIPAHPDDDAVAWVSVTGKRDPVVQVSVEARGWRASITLAPQLHRPREQRDAFRTQEEYDRYQQHERVLVASSWSEPMLWFLRELAERSPLDLAAIEHPQDREPTGYVPRRPSKKGGA